MKNGITVDVCMITYNHESFIKQAIESVLMQKCSYPFKLVIGEDCSTDNTKQICLNYASKYPEIRLLPTDTNLGMIRNFCRTLQACNAKYIALCEGDDYWTDPYKLQKQVDFLEANPDFVLITNNAYVLKDDKLGNAPIQKYVSNFDFDTSKLFLQNYCTTLTVMFRNIIDENLLNALQELGGTDYRLFLLLSKFGKGRYSNEIVGVYRVHGGSVSADKRKSLKAKVLNYENVLSKTEKTNRYLNMQHTKETKIVKKKILRKILKYSMLRMDLVRFIKYTVFYFTIR